jgi:hypothetical protein
MSERQMDQVASVQVRHARIEFRTATLMSRCGDVWQTDLVDISATGVRIERPEDWRGRIGDAWVLDMLFSESVNVHLVAEVVRITAHYIGLAFARIPEEVQEPLWNLLGGYADSLEPWSDA